MDAQKVGNKPPKTRKHGRNKSETFPLVCPSLAILHTNTNNLQPDPPRNSETNQEKSETCSPNVGNISLVCPILANWQTYSRKHEPPEHWDQIMSASKPKTMCSQEVTQSGTGPPKIASIRSGRPRGFPRVVSKMHKACVSEGSYTSHLSSRNTSS